MSRVVVAFLAMVVVVSAQTSTKGTEEFSFLGITSSNDSCANVDCMQGTCVPNDNALLSLLFPYKCQCKSGWATLQQVVPFLAIPSLPCNVPNCSLDLECAGKSPAPAPGSSSPITSANTTACLVPGICGHGTCEVTSTKNTLIPTFQCVCDPGYANVLNMTAGFCVNHCEINGSCQKLNITLPGLSPPPPSSTPTTPTEQDANAGTGPAPSPPEISESVPQGSSPSSSSGWRSTSVNRSFLSAVALCLASAFVSNLC